jgi:transmembrane 9 superfamily protein 1
LGEVLDGDRMAKSTYRIGFKDDVDTAKLCTVTLTTKDIDTLKAAIEDLYYFEFVVGKVYD